jgi:CPA2 family monovalent cation:H+ antiporter-2
MMLFLVGLELQPTRAVAMRNRLLGLGGGQVACRRRRLMGVGYRFRTEPGASRSPWVCPCAFLNRDRPADAERERADALSMAGRDFFRAAVPGHRRDPDAGAAAAAGDHGGGLGHLPGWLQGLAILGVIAAIVGAGRYLMRPIFRFIAAARLREIFTAAALLLVVGIALAMDRIGLSPALGTFLAGVVLSGSEYRHELESDIAPFKGLLLGLFFISVGAGIDFGLLFAHPGRFFGMALALIGGKCALLAILGRLFALRGADLWLFSLGLAQAGEFAFVLFGFATAGSVLSEEVTQTLTLVVAISMLLTPVLFILYERGILPWAHARAERGADAIEETGTAIIAGVGRFGQIVSRMLTTNGFKVVILDHDEGMIDMSRRFGIRSYYGDATRPDLLEAAGVAEARLLVAALDQRELQSQLVSHVARHYPQCRIIARAFDRHHLYELERAGAHHVERELFESALSAGRRALVELGAHPFKAERQARAFRTHDMHTLEELRQKWHEGGMDGGYVDAARARSEQLMAVMHSDRGADRHDTSERGWVPPPKGDAAT